MLNLLGISLIGKSRCNAYRFIRELCYTYKTKETVNDLLKIKGKNAWD